MNIDSKLPVGSKSFTIKQRHVSRRDYVVALCESDYSDGRARMEDIEAQVEADGGRLVVVALPQFSNLVRESAKTHAEIWTPWAASRGETAGVPNALAIDSRPAFEKAMPKLLAGMRKLGFKYARTFVEDSGYWIVTPSIAHQDENLFLDDDMGHYGERGHRVLAKDVFDELKRSGWLEVLARN